MIKKTFKPPKVLSKNSSYSSLSEYQKDYDLSINNNDQFWSKIANRLDWIKKWKKTSDVDFTKPSIKWFLNGKLNVSYNC